MIVEEFDPAAGPQMVSLGYRVGRALASHHAGEAEGRSGWRGGLQWAADLSCNDPDVLLIADDLYAMAPALSGWPGGIVLYAATRMQSLHTGPARFFLLGVFDGADRSAKH